MQAVTKDLSELSTTVAIALSIWLLRKKRRLARVRNVWRQWLQGAGAAQASPAMPAPEPANARPPLPSGRSSVPVRVRPADLPAPAPLEHIEVRDSDWHAWDAAVASQGGSARGRGRGA